MMRDLHQYPGGCCETTPEIVQTSKMFDLTWRLVSIQEGLPKVGWLLQLDRLKQIFGISNRL
jgi:hypothetical protein